MGTIIVAGIVFALAGGAAWRIYKNKKNNQSSCGCSSGSGCGGCKGGCH